MLWFVAILSSINSHSQRDSFHLTREIIKQKNYEIECILEIYRMAHK